MWPMTGASKVRPPWFVLVALALAIGGCATSGRLLDAPRDTIYYPQPPQEPRIQFLTSFSDTSHFRAEVGSVQRFVLGTDMRDVYPIMKPYGVAMHQSTIFVCDTGLGIVHVLDPARKAYAQLGRSGRGKLKKPIGITVTPEGTRYVSDVARGQVVVFDANNRFLRALGHPDEFTPTGCAVIGSEIFVVDVRDNEVERRDVTTGEIQATFGGIGAGVGKLFKPTNITADAEGRIYVTDTLNCRVQIFDREGNVIESFGEIGDALGQFARPKGIAVDPEGLIYVVDAAFENVQVFNQDTDLLLFFGGPGQAPGRMVLPAGIAIGTEGLEHFQKYVDPEFEVEYLILVANQFGPRRVSLYAKGHIREGE